MARVPPPDRPLYASVKLGNRGQWGESMKVTQWFDKLGPSPLSFLLGGLLMLAFGLGLWTFNRRAEAVAK